MYNIFEGRECGLLTTKTQKLVKQTGEQHLLITTNQYFNIYIIQ